MSYLAVAALLLANLAVICVIARDLERLFAYSLCTCRKGAWQPDCPRHGRES